MDILDGENSTVYSHFSLLGKLFWFIILFLVFTENKYFKYLFKYTNKKLKYS